MELYVEKKGEVLKRGLTTGTCAAAAAKAAAISIVTNKPVEKVSVELPNGESVELDVCPVNQEGNKSSYYTVKDAGDDPDVTNGAEIWAEVESRPDNEVLIEGGKGVGLVTKPGLQVQVGDPAINPVPREMIVREVERVLPKGMGALVKISIPTGEDLAGRTMNPKLGIMGGISILGTTGIVEPKSLEAFRDSLVPQISVALAMGHREIVLVPGRRSEKMAVNLGIPQDAIVQTGNFVGFMLKECVPKGVSRVLLLGSLAKLSKLALGYFYTHSGESPSGTVAMAKRASSADAPEDVVNGVKEANTTEEALSILRENGLSQIIDQIAEEVRSRSVEYVESALEVGTVLLSMSGDVIGKSNIGGSSWEGYLS